MTKEQAFQILVSLYPSLRLTEAERTNILTAYKTVESELGLLVKEDKEPIKNIKK